MPKGDPADRRDRAAAGAGLRRLVGLPNIIGGRGEGASRRFIEFFTASIRNRNTHMAYARAVKQFFDWCDEHRLELHEIEAVAVAAYIEQLGNRLRSRPSNSTWRPSGSCSTT